MPSLFVVDVDYPLLPGLLYGSLYGLDEVVVHFALDEPGGEVVEVQSFPDVYGT